MFTSEDWRAILLGVVANIVFLAILALYGWVVKPIQKRRLEKSKVAQEFLVQLVALMLSDSDVARVVYAEVQRTLATVHFSFGIAGFFMIIGHIYALYTLSQGPIQALIVAAVPLFGTIGFVWQGMRFAKINLLYMWATRVYEVQKGIPDVPKDFAL